MDPDGPVYVVDRIMAPKHAYILIPRTSEYVTLHGKRDFADVIKDVELEDLSWIFWVGPI